MAEGGFMRRATDVGFTLVERIAQWEREYGANIAVRDRETTYTYTELFDAARRFASCLASEGIEAGDRIVLQLPNKAESLIILFGSVMRGCIPVLALPTHRKAEISHFCSKSNASCLIVPCSSPAYDYESLAKTIKKAVSYTHLRAHETGRNLVCRLLLEKKKKKKYNRIERAESKKRE